MKQVFQTFLTTSQIEGLQTPKAILPGCEDGFVNVVENISVEESDGTPFTAFNLFAGFDAPNAEWILEKALTNAGMKVDAMKKYYTPEGSLTSRHELCLYSFVKPNGNGGNKNLTVYVTYEKVQVNL